MRYENGATYNGSWWEPQPQRLCVELRLESIFLWQDGRDATWPRRTGQQWWWKGPTFIFPCCHWFLHICLTNLPESQCTKNIKSQCPVFAIPSKTYPFLGRFGALGVHEWNVRRQKWLHCNSEFHPLSRCGLTVRDIVGNGWGAQREWLEKASPIDKLLNWCTSFQVFWHVLTFFKPNKSFQEVKKVICVKPLWLRWWTKPMDKAASSM